MDVVFTPDRPKSSTWKLSHWHLTWSRESNVSISLQTILYLLKFPFYRRKYSWYLPTTKDLLIFTTLLSSWPHCAHTWNTRVGNNPNSKERKLYSCQKNDQSAPVSGRVLNPYDCLKIYGGTFCPNFMQEFFDALSKSSSLILKLVLVDVSSVNAVILSKAPNYIRGLSLWNSVELKIISVVRKAQS